MSQSKTRRRTANQPISRPVLRWLGGKWRIAQWIISQFPPHIAYCEPFGGAANVLLQKPPSKLEIYNDLNSDIVNFFTVLRSHSEELTHQIHLTPFSRDELLLSYQPATDPIERARRLYVRCWQSFQAGSGHDYSPSWRFQKSWARGKSIPKEWNALDHLQAVVTRLKLVQLENRPAIEVIHRFDTEQTLFYVDPPLPSQHTQHGTPNTLPARNDRRRPLPSRPNPLTHPGHGYPIRLPLPTIRTLLRRMDPHIQNHHYQRQLNSH